MSTNALIQPPDPGVYQNVPAEEYHAWDAVSKSTLWKFRELSPHVFRERQLSGTLFNETDALRFGDAFDTLVYDEAEFRERFVIGPVNEKTGKTYGSGTKKWQEFAEANADKTILGQGEYYDLMAMKKSLGDAIPFGKGTSHQVSIVWIDKATGMTCKGRIDTVDKQAGRLIDLKTTSSNLLGGVHGFRRDFFKYGYHVQAAHYLDGMNLIADGVKQGYEFAFVLVGKKSCLGSGMDSEFPVAELDVSGPPLSAGLAVRNSLMSQYADCYITDHWPSIRENRWKIDTVPNWLERESIDTD